MEELTLSEIHDALTYFAAELKAITGATASIGFDVRPGEQRFQTHCYPLGLLRMDDMKSIYERGDDARSVLANLRQSTFEALRAAGDLIIRKMAEAIIRITYDCGECTDAALRGAQFSQEEIGEYGSKACILASEMASKGPFEIVAMTGANAA